MVDSHTPHPQRSSWSEDGYKIVHSHGEKQGEASPLGNVAEDESRYLRCADQVPLLEQQGYWPNEKRNDADCLRTRVGPQAALIVSEVLSSFQQPRTAKLYSRKMKLIASMAMCPASSSSSNKILQQGRSEAKGRKHSAECISSADQARTHPSQTKSTDHALNTNQILIIRSYPLQDNVCCMPRRHGRQHA